MKSYPKIIDRDHLEEIRIHKTFCIVGHVRPDGDCVGSQLGLALALKGEGKKVTVWNEDPMPRKLAFLDPDKLFQQSKPGQKFDCVIATDCASFETPRRGGREHRRSQTVHQHRSSREQYALRSHELGVPARTFQRRTHLSPAESREVADHETDCGLYVHRGLDRYGLLSISDHASRRLTSAPNSSRAVRISRKFVTRCINRIRCRARSC